MIISLEDGKICITFETEPEENNPETASLLRRFRHDRLREFENMIYNKSYERVATTDKEGKTTSVTFKFQPEFQTRR